MLDETGSSGRYDIRLELNRPVAALMSDFPALAPLFGRAGVETLPTELRDQPGQRPEPRTVPAAINLIDEARRPV